MVEFNIQSLPKLVSPSGGKLMARKKKKKIRPGTPLGYQAGMSGQKIRSQGMGRGLGIGQGRGPMGTPIGLKEQEDLQKRMKETLRKIRG